MQGHRLLVLILVGLGLAAGSPSSAEDASRPQQGCVGLGARVMTLGSFEVADPVHRTIRAFPALGGEAFADFAVTPVLAIGAAGQLTGNVIPDQTFYRLGTLWAASLRATASYPTAGALTAYATLTGGYSVITRDGAETAKGPLAGLWVGLRWRLGQRSRLFGQLGYERGFQELNSALYAPSYLVTELGWSLAL